MDRGVNLRKMRLRRRKYSETIATIYTDEKTDVEDDFGLAGIMWVLEG